MRDLFYYYSRAISNHVSFRFSPFLQLTDGSVKTNGVNFPNARFRSGPSVLQTALTKEEPVDTKSELASEESQETIAAKLEAKDSESRSQSAFAQFVSTAASFTTTSANSTSSDSSNVSSSPSHGRSSSNPSSTGFSPSASAPVTNASKSSKTEEVDRPASRPCTGFSEPSSQRRLNMPKLESTLLLQSVRHLKRYLHLGSKLSKI